MKSKFLRKLTAMGLTVASIFTIFSATISASAAEVDTEAVGAGQTSITLKQEKEYAYTSGYSRTVVQMSADSKMVYCVQPDLPAPPNGTYRTDKGNLKEITSSSSKYSMYRKALYYCYGGDGFNTSNSAFKTNNSNHKQVYSGNTPAAFMGNLKWNASGTVYYTSLSGSELHYMFTHLLLSYINFGDSKYNSMMSDYAPYNGYYSQIKELYNAVKSAPEPPVSTKLYMLDLGADYQQVIVVRQSIKLQLQKSSANSSLTSGNSYYSLKNAKFNLYLDEKCTDYFGYIRTDESGYGHYGDGKSENGRNQGADVPLQNYYAKEVEAPKGYKINKSIFKFTNSGKKTSDGTPIYNFTCKDEPEGYPIKLQLIKSSANAEITNGNACYSLSGAEYSIYTDKNCSESSYVSFIRTDKDGYGHYGDGTDTNTDSKDKGTAAYNKNSGKNLAVTGNITYYCKETKAPKGYALDKTVYQFKDSGVKSSDGISIYRAYSLNENSQPKDIPQNDPVNILLKKTDKNGKGLENAEFTINYYDGLYSLESELENRSALKSWIFKTDNDGYSELSNDYLISGDDFYYTGNIPVVPLGTITIQETKAPTGYVIDDTIYIIQITSDNEQYEAVKTYNAPEIPNEPIIYNGKIELTKTDEETAKALSNAVYGIYKYNTVDKDGNLMNAFKSDTLTTGSNGKATSKELENGTYYIQEITPPTGYVRDKTIYPVTINADSENFVVKVNRTDKPISTTISKTDITGQNELPGAKLKVTDSNGNVIEEWTSTTTPHIIKRLPAGEYTLTEEIAPDGYVTASSIKFTVKDDGSVNKVVMKDDTTKYEFTKVDENNNLIKNVTLQVLDSTKTKVIDEWVTDGKTNHQIVGKLVVGETYYLHEKSAPKEYQLAADKKFTVKDTAELQTVTMIDKLKKGSVKLYKQDENGNGIGGSEWNLFKADGTAVPLVQTGSGGYSANTTVSKVTALVTDQNGNLYVYDLPLGNYYFEEIKSPANHMPYGKRIEFTISADSDTTLNREVNVPNNNIVMYETGGNGTGTIFLTGFSMLAISIAVIGIYMIKTKKQHGRR